MDTKTPHLSRSAHVYVSAVIAAGVLAVLYSLHELWIAPVTYHWFILAGLTLLSGSFTIRIPTIPAKLSVSETFVFAAVLLFGAAAATLVVVLDSLIMSLWLKQRSRNPSRVLFNMAAPAVAIWIASSTFYWLAGVEPLSREHQPILTLVGPLLALAVLYFLLNSLLVAGAIAFETHVPALQVWRQNFLWLSLNYFSGASVAVLLLPYLQADYDDFFKVLGVLVPLLLISYLTFKTALGRVDDANRHLSELNRLYLSTIETLAMAIDAKDQITHGHIRRVQLYAVRLAEAIGITDGDQIRAIEAAALLHDTGKLAVPEYILNKPGPLTAAEFDKMKLHASVGADILSAIDFPYPVVPIVRHHHENWDGTGYPDGLSSTDIPIGARILSVVDCFDALTSDRPYRPRLSDKEAIRIMSERRGSMYDPLIVDTFVNVHSQLSIPAFGSQGPFSTINEASSISIPERTKSDKRFDEIAASTDEMLTLFELARGLTSPMDLSDVGDLIAKHLRRLVPCSLCVFYLYDVEADELVAAQATGDQASLVSGLRIGLGQRLSGWVAAHRQTIRNSDATLDLGESARAISPRPRSCIGTPLVSDDSLVGVLTLYSTRSEAFSDEHQRILEVIARQVSAIVAGAADAQHSRANVLRDRLTGLPNLEQMRQALGRDESGALPDPTSLCLLRVNNLAAINARHGQTASEEALGRLAAATRQTLRSADLLFRHESDEFVALLLQTGNEAAEAIAHRIRLAVEAEKKGLDLGFLVAVETVTCPQHGTSLDALVSSARLRATRGYLGDRKQPPALPDSIH